MSTNYRRDAYDRITARERNAPRLKQVCAWCDATIQEGALPVSHGACSDCAKQWLKDARLPVEEGE